MSLTIVERASLTDVGRQRSTNEDSFLESPPVFAVADGMGGARAGEVASRTAVEMLADLATAEGTPEQKLAAAAQAANARIFELAQEDESRSGMGTTLTVVIVSDGGIAVGHVGDSRLYQFRDERLERLTRDHSLVEELVRRGELDPEDVESHPQRAIITRALGPSPEVEPETFTHSARDGDVFLLCSDGLTTMVRDDDIGEIIRSRSSLQDAAKRLVNTANEAGGRDNVTVVLFRIGEADPAPVEEELTQTHLRVEDVQEAAAAAAATDPEPRPPVRPAAPRPAAPRRRRLRAAVTAFLVLLSIGVLIAGFWFGSRQFYFVGTDSNGLIVMYQGVPLDLPADLSMYSPVYRSTVPAAGLPARQRAAVLNHGLRTRGDATELIRSLEQQQTTAHPEPKGQEPQKGDSGSKDSAGGSSGQSNKNGGR